jgi:hypothetical protein
MTEKTAEEMIAEAKAADKAKIAAERASIKAEVGQKMLTDEEKAAAATKEAEVVVTEEAKIEDGEVTIEAHEKTEEELEAEKIEAKTAAEKAKIQRRIDREVGKRKALEDEIKELKAKLAADPEKASALTEEDVETRAEAKAAQKQMVREFEAASDRLFKGGVKTDKEFQAKINALAEDIGKIPGHMIGILDDLDNGGEVLSYFTNNADEAQEIYEMSPAKAAVRLAKLSAKLETEKKPKPKEISKVPDPAETIKGGSQSPDVLPKDPTKNIDQWVKVRNKQVEERRRAKAGLH